MKNIFLLLLLFTGVVEAQIVNIPDANFKAKLLSVNTTSNQFALDQFSNYMVIDANSDGEIQNAEAEAVYQLTVAGGSMQNLIGIEAFTNLSKLKIVQNSELISLDLSGLANLYEVNIYANALLTSINFNGLINLSRLECQYNPQLSYLNLSPLINLEYVSCSDGNLTSLSLQGLSKLNYIDCGFNLLTTIDVSNCPVLYGLRCLDNPLLTSIFLKNGSNESYLDYSLCPNLAFICADDFQIAAIQSNLVLNAPDTQVNSYCSFSPGGNYNTITGNIKYDADNNGCNATDLPQPNIRVNINDGTNTGASFSSSTGNYTFYTQAGSFDIIPSIENPTWFNVSPTTTTIPFADNNNNVATQDFCIAPNGFHPDIEVVISPISFARPGFEASYQITFRNKGNQTFTEGLVGLQFDDSVLDFVAASQPVFALATNQINWMYTNLAPFESRSIVVTFNINSPTAIPAVNIGDLLNFTVSTFPSEVDENPQDNTFEYVQTVVGSYDPNDITCLEGDVVPPSEIGNYLHYAINFENTGTFPAENVVVKTEVDASKFDINSLQLMNTNFPVDARITGTKVEFIFKNIQLPIGGHGHILLKIKTQNVLVTGDEVANRADIFFDYNAPVDTGLANTVFQNLSNTGFEADPSVFVAPNPASNQVIVKADSNIKSIQLYDIQGRIITASLVSETQSKLDISSFAKGTYFVKITTEKGITVQKLLKD
ncbi:T9SS type A sorting domain-containing protein [Flavobacterium sp.]|uniref:DUF7619 domain-containing protein n=1 Tax=Flavobacterium sp. TaxID=239 RepID=UPI0026367182|nr:T9SS type A sorting domain-containing protein [Flavobacterium sp.]